MRRGMMGALIRMTRALARLAPTKRSIILQLLHVSPFGLLKAAHQRHCVSLMIALSACVLTLHAGCGDPPLETEPDASVAELPTTDSVGFPDGTADATPDAEPDAVVDAITDTEPDTAADVVADADATAEVGTPDADAGELPQPDNTAPFVLSTTPADGQDSVAVPFTVEIVFSEKMAVQTLVSQTVWIENVNGNTMPGTLEIAPEGDRLTWTPEFPDGLIPLSSYQIRIDGNVVTDPAGNDLEGGVFSAWFFTGDYPDTENYLALAHTYAPTIRSETLSNKPQASVPTRFDADGDYVGTNNKAWLDATDSVPPAVYYTVNETRSHYFIHYMYFFPWINDNTPGNLHENGAAGAMVVVEKAHGAVEERPIAVTTYFKSKQYEENRTYVTTESGIKGSSSASFYNLELVYDQATLFPDGRFDSYITGGKHESCLWIHEQTATFCNLEGFTKPSLTLLEFAPAALGEVGTPVVKDGSWPMDMDDVTGIDTFTYELVNLDSTLWVRRTQTNAQDGVFSSPVTGHQTDPNRPPPAPAKGAEVPGKFIDSHDAFDSSFGRPVWAWRYFPSSGTLGDEWQSEHGEFGLDPAWYFWKRHRADSETTALEIFDEATLSGFSFDYCFNAKAKLDNRATDTFCQ